MVYKFYIYLYYSEFNNFKLTFMQYIVWTKGKLTSIKKIYISSKMKIWISTLIHSRMTVW